MKRNKMLLMVVIIELIIILTASFYLNSKFPFIFQKQKPSVLVIDIYGQMINSNNLPRVPLDDDSNLVSAEEIMKILEWYGDDNSIKAFILNIDSNGGDTFADEFVNYMNSMKKPIVAVIRDQALSDGYYIAAASDRVFASESSNIADIGVMSIIEYKIGEDWKKCYISSSVYKRMYRDDCPGLDTAYYENEKAGTRKGGQYFASRVAYFRNLSLPYVMQFTDGNIFKGKEALELGLIDEIGGIHEATDWLEKELNMSLEIIYYREVKGKN